MIRIPKHVEELKPYKAGKPIEELAREKGLTKIVKLASNENPLGPSPMAVKAVMSNLEDLHRYTNPSAYRMVQAVAEKYGIAPERIVCGHGSDSLLQYIITAFSEERDEIITSEGTFIGWYVNADKYGRTSVHVPLKDYHYDLEGIVLAVSERTRIIYLANPNNPTGTIFTRGEFERFMERVPKYVLVVLDEAYTVYAEENGEYPNGLEYDMENLIVLRTLSKAYGLAGLRAGFAAAQPYLIREMYKVKLPFEPNMPAQAAAVAAFKDDEFIKRTVELNRVSLEMMRRKFDELNIRYVPTSANFFLLLMPDEAYADRFNEQCLSSGLILRQVKSFGIPNGIRINSGTIEETEFALSVIEKVVLSFK